MNKRVTEEDNIQPIVEACDKAVLALYKFVGNCFAQALANQNRPYKFTLEGTVPSVLMKNGEKTLDQAVQESFELLRTQLGEFDLDRLDPTGSVKRIVDAVIDLCDPNEAAKGQYSYVFSFLVSVDEIVSALKRSHRQYSEEPYFPPVIHSIEHLQYHFGLWQEWLRENKAAVRHPISNKKSQTFRPASSQRLRLP